MYYFVFDLDGECKFIKNKTLQWLKKYVLGNHIYPPKVVAKTYRVGQETGPQTISPVTINVRQITRFVFYDWLTAKKP